MINKGLEVTIDQVKMVMLPEKLLYLPAFDLLCVSDWHLGKAAHFRKSGIAVPQPDLAREFNEIGRILEVFAIKKVLFLGDLFHSTKNNDWNSFRAFIDQFAKVSFLLIKGNHDIIPMDFFAGLKIDVMEQLSLSEQVIFTHEPLWGQAPAGRLNIAGHIHPGYQVTLKARQRFTLPCFYYGDATLVLPAFGELTGLHPVVKGRDHRVFCVLGDEVGEV